VCEDDETELIRRARERDVQAFEELYRRHVARVYAVCLRLTASTRWAEECVQQAFVHAWQRLGQFRGESAFSSWLHRLAINTVLAELRATRRREARVIATDDLEALEPTAAASAPAGLRLDLEMAIAALPAQARVVFVLHLIEGYRHEQIASFLGVAVGTSKAQLHRARHLLQEILR
jgi:RNA polymerase sigma-70 factor (ECF subfamily)